MPGAGFRGAEPVPLLHRMPSHHSIPDWVNAGRRRADLQRLTIRRRRTAAGFGALALLVVIIAIASGGGGGSRGAAQTLNANAQLHPPVLSEPVVVREHRREGRAVDRMLASGIPVVSQGGDRVREIALTFDDGPSVYTQQMLAVLQHFHAPATFFEIGQQIPPFADGTRAIVSDGYWAENHTMTHPFLTHLSASEQQTQLTQAAQNLVAAGAPPPRLFRPPYGDYNSGVVALARRMDMLSVLWSIDTQDYTLPGSPRIVQSVLSAAKPGSIVLMHDGGGPRYETVGALPEIIRGLRARGYTLVSVPRMMLDDPPTAAEALPAGSGLATGG